MTDNEIRNYWDMRARTDPANATTNDFYLREMERRLLLAKIGIAKSVLDIGCGDGMTTLWLAKMFPNKKFLGIDYAPAMIDLALNELGTMRSSNEYGGENVDFKCADFLDFEHDREIDMVISCRCLINMTPENQGLAIEQLKRWRCALALIENFQYPHDNLNKMRLTAGLPEIPVRPHNFYLPDKFWCMTPFADTYYYLTRIVYASRCRDEGVEPDYRHWMHELASKLPNQPELNCAPMRLIEWP